MDTLDFVSIVPWEIITQLVNLLLLFLLFYLSRQKADEELLIAIGLLLIL